MSGITEQIEIVEDTIGFRKKILKRDVPEDLKARHRELMAYESKFLQDMKLLLSIMRTQAKLRHENEMKKLKPNTI